MPNLQRDEHRQAESVLMLANILRATRRWWWLIILATLIAAGAAIRSASHTPRYYRSGTTVMVGRVIQQQSPSANAFTLLDRLTSFYANVATRQPVLDAAAKSVSPPTTAGAIAGRVQARAIAGTQFIEITYSDSDPQRAAEITNAIANELIKQSPTPDALQTAQQAKFAQDQLTDLQAKITDGQAQIKKLEGDIASSSSAAEIADAREKGKELQAQVDGWRTTFTNLLLLTQPSETNYLSIIEPAAIPSVPVGSSKIIVIGMGSILGLALAFGGILIIEYLDDTLRRPTDAPTQTRLPLLATMPRQRRNRIPDPAPYSALRNALLEGAPSTPLRALIAAPRGRAGVTCTAIGLAAAFARAGHRVVLVDGNFLAPTLHTAFAVPPRPGLAEIIANPAVTASALFPSPTISNLTIVTAGDTHGSDDALGGPGLSIGLDTIMAQANADALLVDGGRLGDPTSTSRLLAHHLSQTVLIVTARTRARTVSSIAEALTASGTEIVGLVFNRYHARPLRKNRPRGGRLVQAPTRVVTRILRFFGIGVPKGTPHVKGAVRPAGALAVTPTEPPSTLPPGEAVDMVTED